MPQKYKLYEVIDGGGSRPIGQTPDWTGVTLTPSQDGSLVRIFAPTQKRETPALPAPEKYLLLSNFAEMKDDAEKYGPIFSQIVPSFHIARKQGDSMFIVTSDSNNNLTYWSDNSLENLQSIAQSLHQSNSNAVVVATFDTRETFERQCPRTEAAQYKEKWQLEQKPVLAIRGFEKFISPRAKITLQDPNKWKWEDPLPY